MGGGRSSDFRLWKCDLNLKMSGGPQALEVELGSGGGGFGLDFGFAGFRNSFWREILRKKVTKKEGEVVRTPWVGVVPSWVHLLYI